MQSEIQHVSPVVVEIKVAVPWDRFQQSVEDGFTRLARTAHVRGFRPGKVPRNVLKQLFGAQVRAEATNALVEEGLRSAVTEHNLEPVAPPTVDTPTVDDGKALAFQARLEVRPKIDALNLDGLALTRATSHVADADVDAEIAKLQREHSEIRTPEAARASKAGDVLTIDYDVLVDGSKNEEMSATDRSVDLGEGRLLPELDAALVGATAGDERRVDVSFGDDHGRADLRGKTVTFVVRVKEHRERVLPSLDDEFAKDCGDYAGIAELRAKLRSNLEALAARNAERELRDQAITKLVELNPVPVPPSLLERQEHEQIVEFATFLRMTGSDVPFSEELRAQMKERAERKVRAALLFGEIAKREKMTVTAKDIDAKLKGLAERSGKNVAKLRAEYQGERREALEAQVLEDKLVEYLLGRATITDAPATPATTKDSK